MLIYRQQRSEAWGTLSLEDLQFSIVKFENNYLSFGLVTLVQKYKTPSEIILNCPAFEDHLLKVAGDQFSEQLKAGVEKRDGLQSPRFSGLGTFGISVIWELLMLWRLTAPLSQHSFCGQGGVTPPVPLPNITQTMYFCFCLISVHVPAQVCPVFLEFPTLGTVAQVSDCQTILVL